ncbi:nickel ABC transporter permease subunit NikC, partial [Bacillus altitudinis]|nr:nickel ABC transporter permease subunit NikC [Bacillus altitudinis]
MMTKVKHLFYHQKMISICVVLLGLLLIVTVCAPWIAPHDPATVNLAMKLKGS